MQQKHVNITKQEKLDSYLSSYSMTFDQLLKLVKKGVNDGLKKTRLFKRAFNKGGYLGAPGKDIYCALMLMGLDTDQKFQLACDFASTFPSLPPSTHVHTAACIRYIYGCFDKQGCLLSSDHQKMLAKEDWGVSDRFLQQVEVRFVSIENEYGLVVLDEMKAHRIGDRILIDGDLSRISNMEFLYCQSQHLAVKIKSWKHTFTPFYWMACYCEKIDKNKAIEYHYKNIRAMEKFCPDTREGYQSKAKHSIKYLRKNLSGQRIKDFLAWIAKSRNKCVRKFK